MNSSAAVTAEIPAEVLTVTPTVPVPAGLAAAISVPEMKMTPVAALLPNMTTAPGLKPLPVMVTLVPPAADPLAGETPVTETW